MAWNKGTLDLMADPRKEFADKTGLVLTGLTFRVTVTGWGLIVKAFDPEDKMKKVMFLDAWTLNELFELFYDVVVMQGNRSQWKDDKF